MTAHILHCALEMIPGPRYIVNDACFSTCQQQPTTLFDRSVF